MPVRSRVVWPSFTFTPSTSAWAGRAGSSTRISSSAISLRMVIMTSNQMFVIIHIGDSTQPDSPADERPDGSAGYRPKPHARAAEPKALNSIAGNGAKTPYLVLGLPLIHSVCTSSEKPMPKSSCWLRGEPMEVSLPVRLSFSPMKISTEVLPPSSRKDSLQPFE